MNVSFVKNTAKNTSQVYLIMKVRIAIKSFIAIIREERKIGIILRVWKIRPIIGSVDVTIIVIFLNNESWVPLHYLIHCVWFANLCIEVLTKSIWWDTEKCVILTFKF